MITIIIGFAKAHWIVTYMSRLSEPIKITKCFIALLLYTITFDI